MTAEVSQAPPSASPSDIPQATPAPLESNTEKSEDTGRSIFRKFSISLGGRKNSTKSLEASEEKNDTVVDSVSTSSPQSNHPEQDDGRPEKQKSPDKQSRKNSKTVSDEFTSSVQVLRSPQFTTKIEVGAPFPTAPSKRLLRKPRLNLRHPLQRI